MSVRRPDPPALAGPALAWPWRRVLLVLACLLAVLPLLALPAAQSAYFATSRAMPIR